MAVHRKTLWIGDVHTPDHDAAALSALSDIISTFRPRHVVFLGDFFDCMELSRFKKPHRRNTAKEDIDEGVDVLEGIISKIRRAHNSPTVTFMFGNHEERIIRRMHDEHDLGSFIDPIEVLQLKKVGVDEVKMYNEPLIRHGVYSTHGWLLRQNSGAGYMAKLGMSGVSGHTHRLNQWGHTGVVDELVWCEAGCLLKVDEAGYGHHKDWQQGCVAGWSNTRRGNVIPFPVGIRNGRVTSGMLI